MRIRQATVEDLPAILEIYNEAVLNTTASYDYEPHTLEMRRAWWEQHARDQLPVLVAESNPSKAQATPNISGWAALSRYHHKIGYRFTVEDSIYVASHCRGQGMGSRLLQTLLTQAQNLELKAVIAAIDAKNEPSQRLHARFGFETVGRFKQVGYKFGRWLDVVYMEHLLGIKE